MPNRFPHAALALLSLAAAFAVRAASPADPHLWLEEIEGRDALAWVEARNAATAARLAARPDYAALQRDALAVLESDSRLPEVQPHGRYLYNLWQDAAHPRGLYRRTTPEEFRKESPRWETVLDIDVLARSEGQPWVFGGATWRRPDETRCLIKLSPGGGDAGELREFDAEALAFVPDGFRLPAAKSYHAWLDADTLYVGTDFGPGSMSAAGYPRVVKRWRRGTPLAAATVLHTADPAAVWAFGRKLGTGPTAIHLVIEAITFWSSKAFHLVDGAKHELALPRSARIVDAFGGRLVVWLKDDWTVGGRALPAGTVVLVDPASLRAGAEPQPEVLVESGGSYVVRDVDVTPTDILVTSLDNVRGRLDRFGPPAAGRGGAWIRRSVPFPDHGTLNVLGTDDATGDAWVKFESFTTPPTLHHLPASGTVAAPVKAQRPTFDGERFEAQQHWAVSADGTRVPYFTVGAKALRRDGTHPVWMFAYGGFESALTPAYSGSYEDLKGAYGRLWLERGGVFVLANIRGGGEFGPKWHTSALKENHVKCFEDFEAIARDLVARGLTTPARIGIEGRSNGGLLVAATMVRHPELYGAVVCGAPLLDMQRYHRLLAGASWVAEYGDPDKPDEWAYLSTYSPYQNVRAGQRLPPVLFYTSTRDDRVHPGHARKMAAKMLAQGHAVDYYENTEGGHHGSVTPAQLATRLARTYAFLWEKLGNPPPAPVPATAR